MVRISSKAGFIILCSLLLVIPLLAACSSDKTPEPDPMATPAGEPTQTPEPVITPTGEPTQPPETVTITIGNHTDLTGVAANAMSVITLAVKDTVDYYNEQNLIPGVKVKVIDYDTQYDPSRDIPGYKLLKEKGADVLFGTVASAGLTLKPFLEEDKIVMIMMSANPKSFIPPGYVFALGNASYEEQLFTLLKWISENDPDFPADRPAKIGGAMFGESAGIAIIEAAEKYAKANPEQYEWVEGFLTSFQFIWTAEAHALKDCDYVIPATPPSAFVKDYRKAGGKGKFIGTDAHTAFMGMVNSSDLWEEMDGMYSVRPFRWWTDDSEGGRLTRQILNENHADQAEEIIRDGVGYITVQPIVMLLEAIKGTVEEVGAENFTSEDLYNYLLTFSMDFDGCQHSFSETKRTSNDYLNIHQLDAERKDFFLAHEGWVPIVTEP